MAEARVSSIVGRPIVGVRFTAVCFMPFASSIMYEARLHLNSTNSATLAAAIHLYRKTPLSQLQREREKNLVFFPPRV